MARPFRFRFVDTSNELGLDEDSGSTIDRFDEGAIDGDEFSTKRLGFQAEKSELSEDLFESVVVGLPEVTDRAVIGLEVCPLPQWLQGWCCRFPLRCHSSDNA